jgi:lysophospholipase L1-like esterase
LVGNKINPELFLSDGLHPNAEGYDVLGRDLMKLLMGKSADHTTVKKKK